MKTDLPIEINFDEPLGSQAFTGERFVTGMAGDIEHEHHHRYLFARDLVRDKDVLDIASGEGYGTSLLAQVAQTVVGVDIDQKTISFSLNNYVRPNLSFKVGSATQIPCEDASFDVVVSFETIEHFSDHDDFLGEIKRVLRPDGLLIISSPAAEVYSPDGSSNNDFHQKELSSKEFRDLVGRYFAETSFYTQVPLAGSFIYNPLATGTSVLERTGPGQYAKVSEPTGLYLIALASNKEHAELVTNNGVLHNSHHHRELYEALAYRTKNIDELGKEIANKSSSLEQLEDALASRSKHIEQLQVRVAELSRANQFIEEQFGRATRSHLSDIETLKRSTSWRVTAPMRRLRPVVVQIVRPALRTMYDRINSPRTRAYLNSRFPTITRKAMGLLRDNSITTHGALPANYPDLYTTTLNEPDVAQQIERIFSQIVEHSKQHGPVSSVLTLNFNAGGGAEQATFGYAQFYAERVSNMSIILILTDNGPREVISHLPSNVMILDLALSKNTPSDQREAFLYFIIKALSPETLHIVNSTISYSLLHHLPAEALVSTRVIVSVFALQFMTNDRNKLTGYAADLLPSALPSVDMVITDNLRFAVDAPSILNLPELSDKVKLVYNKSRLAKSNTREQAQALLTKRLASISANPRLQVVWAGRLDAEKRIDLLREIAEETTSFCDFHVFGKQVVDHGTTQLFSGCENIVLHGAYRSPLDFDKKVFGHVFLFTSRWEGMPNALVEAAYLGFPIVASAVGGVTDLVDAGTGYPVPSTASATTYASYLSAVQNDLDMTRIRAEALISRVFERHSQEAFNSTMSRLFS